MTEVKLHIEICKEGDLVITEDRIKLLRLISEAGSLLTASKKIGISYNKAWTLLDSINNVVGSPVVEKSRGGNGGGGAVLTSFGKNLLREYEAIEQQVSKFSRQLNTEINY